MKQALVCGAGGFIGGHLVRFLKKKGYWVRGVDIRHHKFLSNAADEFHILDLRGVEDCHTALTTVRGREFDEVYQLAADMGGVGYITLTECPIMRNSALININMIDAATRLGVPRYFFSSSVCVYRDMEPGEPEMTEDEAYPAFPDNEYGWEKLYAERMMLAHARRFPIQMRIARFQNCYGPHSEYMGIRAKAPAAICRKVALAEDGGTIEVWGDGSAVRCYTYIDDMLEGIYTLMQSDLRGPVNIGSSELTTVNELVATVAGVAGKRVSIKHTEGTVGVQYRNFSKARIHSLGWQAETPLREGIAYLYSWMLREATE